MTDWRDRLKRALDAREIDMKRASLSAGLNAAAVQQIIKGNDPKASTLQQLARSNGLSLDEILLDRPHSSTAEQVRNDVRLAPVVGTVAAGLWFLPDAPPQVEPEPVPYVPCRHPDLAQTAYKVVGSSMNKRNVHDGDFVVTVPYWEARMAPVAGDIAVVQRSRDGGLVELTIKEIEVTRESVRLVPRSTEPEYQDVIIIPRTIRPELYEDVTIIGLVVGKFSTL
ncbi:LexA family protein [Methylobacterium sp. NPDC080182]|uniref:LexA family protein n=1 Tax=Methylobacterium sp. NPDC080182 TaxID=3390590 RepID=UPI003CFD4571